MKRMMVETSWEKITTFQVPCSSFVVELREGKT